MPRSLQALPIPPRELLGLQGNLAPHASTLWEDGDVRILVARIPGRDPDLVNDLERVAEWASASDVLQAQACVLLTSHKVHTLPMAPIRSHVERRIAMDRRQASLLREQLPAGLSHKLYRAVDDPYRRVRLGVKFPEGRMRDVDDDRLDELAVRLGVAMTDGGFDDVHCIHLVADQDDVRLAPDAFLADMLPRLKDDKRRVDAQQRLLQRQHDDAVARGEETASLRRSLGAGHAPVKTRADRDAIDWDANADDDGPMARVHADVDAALAARTGPKQGGVQTASTQAGSQAMAPGLSELRQHLDAAGYALRVHPSVPGHTIHLAAERLGEAPQRILAWGMDRLDRDGAERALAAVRDLQVDLGIVVAPEATADGQRILVATRARWVTPDRVRGLRV